MPKAEDMLCCALTYRDAELRTEALPTKFSDHSDAIQSMRSVLLHEARESMSAPLVTMPQQCFLHPVDIDTDEPGIVYLKQTESMRYEAVK